MIEIPLTRGLVALIDDADLPLVAPYSWHATKGRTNRTWYARAVEPGSHAGRRHVYMHRLLLGLHRADPRILADHRDGNSLDNRRHNLRCADAVHNGANRACKADSASGFKGVYASGSGWRARIGKPMRGLGSFATAEEAALAYDAEALSMWGEFARLNLPQSSR